MSEPIYTIKMPVYTWRVWLTPNTTYCVEEGKQPNAFHRFMQRATLGFRWEKIKSEGGR